MRHNETESGAYVKAAAAQSAAQEALFLNGLIPPHEFRRALGGISRSTEWRRRKTDPDFPRRTEDGNYFTDEAVAYLQLLRTRRDREKQK
jgi:hypothetical protein